MDKIFLRELEFESNHGVYDSEKEISQTFIISTEIYYDATNAKISDKISEAISYSEAYTVISQAVHHGPFNLLEKLSYHIAMQLKNKFKQITSIHIEVQKRPNSWNNRKYGSVGFATTITF